MSLFQFVQTTQAFFRVMLKATSYPGRCQKAVADNPDTPGALVLCFADCLVDHETTFALTGRHRSELGQSVERRTGASRCELGQADFIFVAGDHSHGRAAEAKRGVLAYPDLGATLIYQLPDATTADLETNRLNSIVFSGPGIKGAISPPARGLDSAEYVLLRDINADYPLGVDAFIIWGNAHIMAIPRSTRIKVN